MEILYVLPHAGGAAHSYRFLRDALQDRVDVRCLELPGRGRRAAEPGVQSWDEAIHEVSRLINPPLARTWALFGHSMGALLGVEVLRQRALRGLPMPAFFAPSGSPSPATRKREPIAHLPGAAFWTEVERYGGVPTEILAVADFRDYFESILRKDFAIIEDSRPLDQKLNVPVHVFFGIADMSIAEAESWRDVTSGDVQLHGFSGDHFFLFQHADEIARTVDAAFGRAR
ncbi:MAG: thioesterase [Rhodobacteraceae bacterium]|nr:thioesterase [Paracoccaceae bacterium]